ncbi:MAG TPA: PH domain-containing protein, partial [Gaiellaceae bacterium]|nr:PH domain-containing protein [Gaiellaceae bacterium]
VLIGLLGVGWYYLEWRRERYLVTTRRVIEAGGIISTFSRDTSLQMITDMLVSHPWLGRILGYGQIDLLTASEAGTNRIRFLPRADEFKRSLLDARHEYELEVGGGKAAHEAAVTPAPAPADAKLSGEEVDSSITHLAGLRDRGLITPEEFEQKKQELLDRL